MPILFRMKQGVGKHYLRRGGKVIIVRPGETIRCEPWEIKAGKDKFEQLEPDFTASAQPKVGLKAVHLGFGKWNVINETTGQKINEEPLTKKEALALASSQPEDNVTTGKEGVKGAEDEDT